MARNSPHGGAADSHTTTQSSVTVNATKPAGASRPTSATVTPSTHKPTQFSAATWPDTGEVDLHYPEVLEGWAEAYLDRTRREHREKYDWMVDSEPIHSDLMASEAVAYLAGRVGAPTTKSESPTISDVGGLGFDGTDPFPWAGDLTGPDKTRLVLMLAVSGDSPTDPVPLGDALDAAFGASEPKHYQRAAWLDEHHPELVEKDTKASVSGLRVTGRCLYLIRSMQSASRLPWAGPSLDRSDDGEAASLLPKDRFHGTIGSTRGRLNDRQLALALTIHAEGRQTLVGSDGEAKILADGTDPSEQRFASVGRANGVYKSLSRRCDALERVADEAVAVTLTMPRACADGPVDSYAVMSAAWGRLYHRLRRSDVVGGSGSVPPYVWVQEPQRDGWAHRHVIIGVPRLMDPDALRAEWADCLRIPECAETTPWVRLHSLTLAEGWHARGRAVTTGSDGSAPVPSDPSVAADGLGLPGLRAYYAKGPRLLTEMAASTPTELFDRAARLRAGGGTERDRDMARLTFMWPTEPPFEGGSQVE